MKLNYPEHPFILGILIQTIYDRYATNQKFSGNKAEHVNR
jgi:hypothetical protein